MHSLSKYNTLSLIQSVKELDLELEVETDAEDDEPTSRSLPYQEIGFHVQRHYRVVSFQGS